MSRLYILSPCLFNLYAEYIRQNARLDEAQTGTKISRRNINNLRYTYDTTLIAEGKEKLKRLNKVIVGKKVLMYFLTAAAAAKSLQSCPTLCDPRDGSPPGKLVNSDDLGRLGE